MRYTFIDVLRKETIKIQQQKQKKRRVEIKTSIENLLTNGYFNSK